MLKSKTLLLNIPEYLLIGAVLFYWFSSGSFVNPLAWILIAVLVLQSILENRILGLLIPSLLMLLSFYMCLAVISEFNEFPNFSQEAAILLFTGLGLFVGIMALSVMMMAKYLLQKTNG